MNFCQQSFLFLLLDKKKIRHYLLGNPVYPLILYCLKDYQSCSSNDELLFNTMLRAERNLVEYALGRLKARCTILTRKIDFKLESVPFLIYACFVLHNFCNLEWCHLDKNLIRMQIEHRKAEKHSRPSSF